MSEKRRGLGRGLGALIPPAPPSKSGTDRPVDVFFPSGDDNGKAATTDVKARSETPAPVVPEQASPVGTATVIEAPPTAPGLVVPAPDPVGPESAASNVPAPEQPVAVQQPAEPSGPDMPEGLVPVPGAYFAEIRVDSIRPNPKQPRQVFDEESLAELVHSVKEIGVLQPIVVRSLPLEGGEPRFELIMGERRWRATQEAGLERIPAIVKDTSDDDMLRDALLENLHRSQLNPLEEAAAYQQLLEDFGCTHEELATRIGRSRPQISNTIRLLRLPPAVQLRVAAGVLSAGHARALLGLDDAEAMDKLAQRIVSEGLSVRATEEAVAVTDSQSPVQAKRRPRAGGHHAELDDLASRLADRLDTRVSISLGRTKGKLSVEFASVEDLNRILDILAPQERKAFQE